MSDYDINDIDRIDVQDRFGTFIAIKWPENQYSESYDIRITQDVLPAVLAYMFGEEELFDSMRLDRNSTGSGVIGGVEIIDGIIHGGKDDGKPLFETTGVRRSNAK